MAYTTHQCRGIIEKYLTAFQVHPEEVDRLAMLGELPETLGIHLRETLLRGHLAGWLVPDADPQYTLTDCNSSDAAQMERMVASGIGSGEVKSLYKHLCIGATTVDAPLAIEYIHINVLLEDMRFGAAGPRIFTDGMTIPLPNDFFESIAGYHIPFMRPYIEPLVPEMYRTLKPGRSLQFAPSTNVNEFSDLLVAAGFENVRTIGMIPSTPYKSARTRPTHIVEATKPLSGANP